MGGFTSFLSFRCLGDLTGPGPTRPRPSFRGEASSPDPQSIDITFNLFEGIGDTPQSGRTGGQFGSPFFPQELTEGVARSSGKAPRESLPTNEFSSSLVRLVLGNLLGRQLVDRYKVQGSCSGCPPQSLTDGWELAVKRIN